MSEGIKYDRRRFFVAVAMSIAAAQLGIFGSAAAQSGKAKPADLVSANAKALYSL